MKNKKTLYPEKKKWKKLRIIFISLFLTFFSAAGVMFIYEVSMIQKLMNGIHNYKLLGQAMLAYEKENHALPFDEKGNICLSKLFLDKKKLKNNAVPDISLCRKVKDPDIIGAGTTEKIYSLFSWSVYVIKMSVKPDGSVTTEKQRF